MSHDEFNFWRRIRIRLYAFGALFFTWRATASPGHRMFFSGTISFFVSLRRLDHRDLAALAREEELCREDPKHLFRCDTGQANSPDLGRWAAGSLVLTFERAGQFPVPFHLGLRFWCAVLCFAGVVVAFFSR